MTTTCPSSPHPPESGAPDLDALVVGGGQAGLAAAYHLQRGGLRFVLLEAGERPVGSWPLHYDSLRLFSPAKHASLPGLPFPGDPEAYPTRDEVVAYLDAYAQHFAFPIRTRTEVTQVLPTRDGFRVLTADGETFRARTVIAATGTFRKPFVPQFPGREHFQGEVLHSLRYRHPEPLAGKRVVVVGAANSAVQIAVELAGVARVTLASRSRVSFFPQRPLGRDVHDWSAWLRVDQWPLGRWRRLPSPRTVFDPGLYRAAFRAERLDRRPVFTHFTSCGVVWQGGQEEAVDAVIFATGYRTNLDFLRGTGALDRTGEPFQRLGISTTVPGLSYVGLSGQRAPASATLRGSGPDAELVVAALSKALKERRSS